LQENGTAVSMTAGAEKRFFLFKDTIFLNNSANIRQKFVPTKFIRNKFQ